MELPGGLARLRELTAHTYMYVADQKSSPSRRWDGAWEQPVTFQGKLSKGIFCRSVSPAFITIPTHHNNFFGLLATKKTKASSCISCNFSLNFFLSMELSFNPRRLCILLMCQEHSLYIKNLHTIEQESFEIVHFSPERKLRKKPPTGCKWQ